MTTSTAKLLKMSKNSIVLNNDDIQIYEKDENNTKEKNLKINRIKDRRKNNHSVNVGNAVTEGKIYYDGKILTIYS